MKKLFFIIPLLAVMLSSCLGDDASDILNEYSQWKTKNEDYVSRMEMLIENNQKVYTKVVPSWATSDFVLIKWHNDRALTEKNLVAMSNSTVNIKYEMEDVDGNSLGNSYSLTTWGDSIYQSQPNQNIIGMWAAMTHLHVGDSVTLVIPAQSAYGYTSRGEIKPFSALIYHMKLVSIPKYEN